MLQPPHLRAATRLTGHHGPCHGLLGSELNPNATPFIVALDVTGSMGRVVEAMRKGLGALFEQVITQAVIPDPHVLAIAIGDFGCDRAPIQVTQFESEPVTIGRQIEDLWLERASAITCQ